MAPLVCEVGSPVRKHTPTATLFPDPDTVTPAAVPLGICAAPKGKWRESLSVLANSLQSHGPYSPWDSPGQNTGVSSLSLLQGIFPTQGSNWDILHCQQILYQLSHQGSPRILEWVAYPFSRGSSQPRDWTRVACIAGRFFTNWAIRKALVRGCVNFSLPLGIHKWTGSWTKAPLF